MRVEALLGRMTLQEKVNQLLFPMEDLGTVRQKYARTSLGALYIPDGNVTATNEIQRYFVSNSRLNIPLEWVQEALHGGAQGGTIFPMPVGMSSTWNVGTKKVYLHSWVLMHSHHLGVYVQSWWKGLTK